MHVDQADIALSDDLQQRVELNDDPSGPDVPHDVLAETGRDPV